MDITNFERIRVGSHYPQVLDIEPIGLSEHGSGIYAAFYAHDTEDGLRRVELRYKDSIYGLFLFRYEDQGLPDWWRDSKVVWSLPST